MATTQRASSLLVRGCAVPARILLSVLGCSPVAVANTRQRHRGKHRQHELAKVAVARIVELAERLFLIVQQALLRFLEAV